MNFDKKLIETVSEFNFVYIVLSLKKLKYIVIILVPLRLVAE